MRCATLRSFAALTLSIHATSADAQLTPEQVLVVYDARIPSSIEVAEYYAGSATVTGGPSGDEPGAQPNVRAVDLADLGAAPLSGPDIAVATYLSELRDPLRQHLIATGLELDIRCLVLCMGMPHRILDFDDPQTDLDPDDATRPIGDRPRDLLDERVEGDASLASVDSELTLLWQDTLDTEAGEPGDSIADGALINPYHRETTSINAFSNANILAAKAFTTVEDWFTIGADPAATGAARFTAGDFLLVTRLDGHSVSNVKALIDRAANVVYDPAAHAIVLDESGSEGAQDLSGADDELDNAPSALNVSDDYEATRDLLLADGRFAPELIRYDALAGEANFLVGPRRDLPDLVPDQIVTDPVILLASYGANHGGGQPGGRSTARRLAESFNIGPAAVFSTLESFNARAFNGISTLVNQEQAADFIAEGGAFAVGNVFEPLADSVADIEMLVRNFVLGELTWAEAAWSSIPALGWVQVVIGDPLATATLAPTMCNEADLAEPFGTHDIADVVRYLELFGQADPAADFAPPTGDLDIADVVAFLQSFGAGCP